MKTVLNYNKTFVNLFGDPHPAIFILYYYPLPARRCRIGCCIVQGLILHYL